MIHAASPISYGIPRHPNGRTNMPVIINGQTYYRTAEVCRLVGISRNTLFRWGRETAMSGAEHRDFRGWRPFTPAQVEGLKGRVGRVVTIDLRS